MICLTLEPVSWRPTTAKWRQFSQSNRLSTIGIRQTEYHEALPSSANDEVRCDCTFADYGSASWYSVCRVPMVEWRLDCEDCSRPPRYRPLFTWNKRRGGQVVRCRSREQQTPGGGPVFSSLESCLCLSSLWGPSRETSSQPALSVVLFYLSVAARKIVWSVPEIHSHVAGTLSNQQTTTVVLVPAAVRCTVLRVFIGTLHYFFRPVTCQILHCHCCVWKNNYSGKLDLLSFLQGSKKKQKTKKKQPQNKITQNKTKKKQNQKKKKKKTAPRTHHPRRRNVTTFMVGLKQQQKRNRPHTQKRWTPEM